MSAFLTQFQHFSCRFSAPSQHLPYIFSALVKNSISADSAPFLHNFTCNFFAHHCLERSQHVGSLTICTSEGRAISQSKICVFFKNENSFLYIPTEKRHTFIISNGKKIIILLYFSYLVSFNQVIWFYTSAAITALRRC